MKSYRLSAPVVGLVAGVAVAAQVSAGFGGSPTTWQWVCLGWSTVTAGLLGAWSLRPPPPLAGDQQDQKKRAEICD
jgi:hypothetical protein